MKRTLFAALMVLLSSLSCLAAEEACVRYKPAVVQLLGRVFLRTFPGPPNYESIRKGDRAETQALLDLDQPVCVLADPKDTINSEDERDQRLVTLVLASGMKLASYVGARVRVDGTLFHAHTGHHRTPILVEVSRMTRLGRVGTDRFLDVSGR
jgi:Domain of unknown function (DUF4431)